MCDIRCSLALSTRDKCSCKCGGEGHGKGWEVLNREKAEQERRRENESGTV